MTLNLQNLNSQHAIYFPPIKAFMFNKAFIKINAMHTFAFGFMFKLINYVEDKQNKKLCGSNF